MNCCNNCHPVALCLIYGVYGTCTPGIVTETANGTRIARLVLQRAHPQPAVPRVFRPMVEVGGKQEPGAVVERAVKGGRSAGSPKGAAKAALKPAVSEGQADAPVSAPQADPSCDPVTETAVLLESVIHDLRTPLSAMSGWLEVLEAHFGEADGIVGRALLGLRRGVDSQTAGLSSLSEVLMKQRLDLPVDGDCVLLERMRTALEQLEARPDSPVDRQASARLAALKNGVPGSSLKCRDAGTSLTDAFGTLLQALAVAQDDADPPLTIAADDTQVVITVPASSGDISALKSICQGLASYSARRPEIRAPALWLARSMLRRCELVLQMNATAGGGFDLLLRRAPQGLIRAS